MLVDLADRDSKELKWNQPQPMGSDTIVADPQFVAPASGDYRLQPASPAAGAGVPLPGVPVDIDNNYFDPVSPNLGAHAK